MPAVASEGIAKESVKVPLLATTTGLPRLLSSSPHSACMWSPGVQSVPWALTVTPGAPEAGVTITVLPPSCGDAACVVGLAIGGEVRTGELADSSGDMRERAARTREIQQPRGFSNSRMPTGAPKNPWILNTHRSGFMATIGIR